MQQGKSCGVLQCPVGGAGGGVLCPTGIVGALYSTMQTRYICTIDVEWLM